MTEKVESGVIKSEEPAKKAAPKNEAQKLTPVKPLSDGDGAIIMGQSGITQKNDAQGSAEGAPIDPDGQQTVDDGAGAIVKDDGEPKKRANKKSKLDVHVQEVPVDVDEEAVDEVEESDQVILYSQRNLHWDRKGTLTAGFNVVNKDVAQELLEHPRVRKATVQEVKDYYGR